MWKRGYYDPELGRFISPDPILDGFNRYAYCGNNPVKYIDPSGNLTQEHKDALDAAEDAGVSEEELDDMYQGFLDEEKAAVEELKKDIRQHTRKMRGRLKIRGYLEGDLYAREMATLLRYLDEYVTSDLVQHK